MSTKSMCIDRIKECIKIVELCRDKEHALEMLRELRDADEKIFEEVKDGKVSV